MHITSLQRALNNPVCGNGAICHGGLCNCALSLTCVRWCTTEAATVERCFPYVHTRRTLSHSRGPKPQQRKELLHRALCTHHLLTSGRHRVHLD